MSTTEKERARAACSAPLDTISAGP
jgi:hypothetical protein